MIKRLTPKELQAVSQTLCDKAYLKLAYFEKLYLFKEKCGDLVL